MICKFFYFLFYLIFNIKLIFDEYNNFLIEIDDEQYYFENNDYVTLKKGHNIYNVTNRTLLVHKTSNIDETIKFLVSLYYKEI